MQERILDNILIMLMSGVAQWVWHLNLVIGPSRVRTPSNAPAEHNHFTLIAILVGSTIGIDSFLLKQACLFHNQHKTN